MYMYREILYDSISTRKIIYQPLVTEKAGWEREVGGGNKIGGQEIDPEEKRKREKSKRNTPSNTMRAS